MKLQCRRQIRINTDPQQRCYNGSYISSEIRWSDWAVFDHDCPQDRVEWRLDYWRRLNAYAVSQRGEMNTLEEYRALDDTGEVYAEIS